MIIGGCSRGGSRSVVQGRRSRLIEERLTVALCTVDASNCCDDYLVYLARSCVCWLVVIVHAQNALSVARRGPCYLKASVEI
jgi:hypothetical protein